MSNLAFDTHKFVKDLAANGMPNKQAEVLADHYASLLNDRLATKEDLFGLRKELKGDISDLQKDMSGLEERLQSDMTNLEERLMNKLTIRILTAQLVGIVTICTIIGFMLTL